jgi:predicted RNA-binding Zn-ribbon protein involved in translation (DUF1610 family)
MSVEERLEKEIGHLRWKAAKLSCPRCGTRGVIPILWGLVVPPLDLAEERGEVKLGGCTTEDGREAEWSCTSCGLDFAARG